MNTQKFRVFKTTTLDGKVRWAVRQPGCNNLSLGSCLHQSHLWCGNYWSLPVAQQSAHRHATYLARKAPIYLGTMANINRSTR